MERAILWVCDLWRRKAASLQWSWSDRDGRIRFPPLLGALCQPTASVPTSQRKQKPEDKHVNGITEVRLPGPRGTNGRCPAQTPKSLQRIRSWHSVSVTPLPEGKCVQIINNWKNHSIITHSPKVSLVTTTNTPPLPKIEREAGSKEIRGVLELKTLLRILGHWSLKSECLS